ncbi:hypothetical protein GCM10023085_14730 [Actinomadura viridis]|uniref:Regulator of protease activity HflC (Stomatin/prohibitin superfamily) n=1 Tax=Actinomadura viridis TaxID=58110 RepID=A0A931GN09_9ACTN|nr:SPFH domain-containing protein [Actinomadura viridis]MBG6093843.1 regulator of protease activity HflC (stomatin/prohibitin superfamily) [Actinomadura viridis]
MTDGLPAGGLMAAATRPDDTVAWGSAVLLLLVLAPVLVAMMVRVVPGDERLVVSRFGGATTVRGPGRVLVIPGIDRWVRVPLKWEPLDVWLEAVTRDGAVVRLKAIALVSVSDPERFALRTAPHPSAAVSVIVESQVRRHVAGLTLAELGGSASGPVDAPADVDAAVGGWGLSVSLLEIVRADVPLHSVLRWAADGRKPS